jgi:hypothetical protein
VSVVQVRKTYHLCIPKLTNLRPKCAKCGGGHKTDNCGLKCFFFVQAWGILKIDVEETMGRLHLHLLSSWKY